MPLQQVYLVDGAGRLTEPERGAAGAAVGLVQADDHCVLVFSPFDGLHEHARLVQPSGRELRWKPSRVWWFTSPDQRARERICRPTYRLQAGGVRKQTV